MLTPPGPQVWTPFLTGEAEAARCPPTIFLPFILISKLEELRDSNVSE